MYLTLKQLYYIFEGGFQIQNSSPAGFEPATSGLEVQRAIHCATGTYRERNLQRALPKLTQRRSYYITSESYPNGDMALTVQSKNGVLVCPRRGLNPGSSVYETDALPLGHRGSSRYSSHLLTYHQERTRCNMTQSHCVSIQCLNLWLSCNLIGVNSQKLKVLPWLVSLTVLREVTFQEMQRKISVLVKD